MRSFIHIGLIGCFLCVAIESSAYGQGAGMCREPECGRTENDRTNKDRNRQQGDNRQQDTSGEKDRSPCGPNPPDKGFVYYGKGEGKLRSDPSGSSDVVGQLPRGTRLVYDRITNSGGERWYHVNHPGGRSGWMPSSDVVCERPTNPPPPKPDRVVDCDIPVAPSTSPGPTGARGFAPGSACDEYQRQQEPVSFR